MAEGHGAGRDDVDAGGQRAEHRARPCHRSTRNVARWEAIAREAAEQCGRGLIPAIAPAVELASAVRDATGLRLMPWEGDGSSHDLPGLADALAAVDELPRQVSLLIGPEGGLAADEAAAARAAGWRLVSLGPRILRAETAALTSLSLLMGAYGRVGERAACRDAYSRKV